MYVKIRVCVRVCVCKDALPSKNVVSSCKKDSQLDSYLVVALAAEGSTQDADLIVFSGFEICL